MTTATTTPLLRLSAATITTFPPTLTPAINNTTTTTTPLTSPLPHGVSPDFVMSFISPKSSNKVPTANKPMLNSKDADPPKDNLDFWINFYKAKPIFKNLNISSLTKPPVDLNESTPITTPETTVTNATSFDPIDLLLKHHLEKDQEQEVEHEHEDPNELNKTPEDLFEELNFNSSLFKYPFDPFLFFKHEIMEGEESLEQPEVENALETTTPGANDILLDSFVDNLFNSKADWNEWLVNVSNFIKEEMGKSSEIDANGVLESK